MLTTAHLATTPSDRPSHRDFLDNTPLGSQVRDITFLAGDASFRKYYRVTCESGVFVLMDAPPPEDPERFVQVASFLLRHDLSAPAIMAMDLENGYVLLGDFGDLTYTRALTPENAEHLYFTAIDTLIHLHKVVDEKPAFLADYSLETHLREAQLLTEWYYPRAYGHPIPPNTKAEYDQVWQEALEMATTRSELPCALVLRDYHVDNLMVLDHLTGIQQCGLLDFQDALWGSITYDVVSLLEDARRDLTPELVEKCWQRYCAAFPDLNPEQIRTEATILSAARHAKIIGIFTRLAVRDNKMTYLHHIPRVWRLLHNCLKHPALANVKAWFDQHIPTH